MARIARWGPHTRITWCPCGRPFAARDGRKYCALYSCPARPKRGR